MSCPWCHYQNVCFDWISMHGYLEPNNLHYTVNGFNVSFWAESYIMLCIFGYKVFPCVKIYQRPSTFAKIVHQRNLFEITNKTNPFISYFSIPITSFNEHGASCYRIDLATTSSWQRYISPARLQSRSLLYPVWLARKQGCFALISSYSWNDVQVSNVCIGKIDCLIKTISSIGADKALRLFSDSK